MKQFLLGFLVCYLFAGVSGAWAASGLPLSKTGYAVAILAWPFIDLAPDSMLEPVAPYLFDFSDQA